jgi:hypothetical protein
LLSSLSPLKRTQIHAYSIFTGEGIKELFIATLNEMLNRNMEGEFA